MIYIRNPTYLPVEGRTQRRGFCISTAALWNVGHSAEAWSSTACGPAAMRRSWTRDGGGPSGVMFTRTRTPGLRHTEIACVATALLKQPSQPVCAPCRSSRLGCR